MSVHTFRSRDLNVWKDPVGVNMKRHSVSKGHSKALFTKTASKTHHKNVPNGTPLRGGIRL